jgi:hypothetical protein
MIFRELFIKGRLMKQVILKRFEVSDETIYFVHDYGGSESRAALGHSDSGYSGDPKRS